MSTAVRECPVENAVGIHAALQGKSTMTKRVYFMDADGLPKATDCVQVWRREGSEWKAGTRAVFRCPAPCRCVGEETP